MKNGGARPGSGMKKGTVLKKTIEKKIRVEHMRKYFLDRVAQEIGPIVEAQLALAKGFLAVRTVTRGRGKNRKTTEEVYKVPPDASMVRYMLDQSLGKATDSIELAGKDGQAINVTFFKPSVDKWAKKEEEKNSKKPDDKPQPDKSTDLYLE